MTDFGSSQGLQSDLCVAPQAAPTRPPFAFGSDNWPGLAKLNEEAGEAIQVVGRLMMTGGKPHHWDGGNLRRRLQDELADLSAAIAFVVKVCDLDGGRMSERSARKFDLFTYWHEGGEEIAIPVGGSRAATLGVDEAQRMNPSEAGK